MVCSHFMRPYFLGGSFGGVARIPMKKGSKVEKKLESHKTSGANDKVWKNDGIKILFPYRLAVQIANHQLPDITRWKYIHIHICLRKNNLRIIDHQRIFTFNSPLPSHQASTLHQFPPRPSSQRHRAQNGTRRSHSGRERQSCDTFGS